MFANLPNSLSGLVQMTFSQTLQGSALEVTADFAKEVLETRDAGTIAGASWVALNGLRGILRRQPPIEPSKLPSAEEGLHLAKQQPALLQLLRAAFGNENVIYNLWGLYETFRSIGAAQGEYARIVGLKKYFEDYLAIVKNGPERLEGNDEFSKVARCLYAEWVLRYARSHGMDVRFEGTEKIPSEGLVVYAMAPHVAIYPDFWLTYADPRLVPVADAHNFRDNRGSKLSGVALVVDKTSLPLVDRSNPRDETRLQHLLDASLKHDVRPAWFVTGGRVPRAYRDDGTPDRPGLYSNIPDPSPRNVDNYIQNGGVFGNALGLARKSGQPVTILVVTLRGTECMPKVSRKFPFIQKNRSGGQIIYRVVESIQVQPTDTSKRIVEVDRKIKQIVRSDLQIDDYLREITAAWGHERGRTDAAARLKERGAKDEQYYTLADRIRALPPSQVERRQMTDRFVELLYQDPAPGRREIKGGLLTEVSEVLKTAQYL